LLQQSLNQLDFGYDLTVDGSFGPSTRIAVLDFQGRNNLPADGNAGEQTLSELSWQTESVSSPTPGDPIAPSVVGPSLSGGEGVPPPSREDRPGATDCGIIAPQQAFVAFYGPERQYLDTDTLNDDGTVTQRGEKVVGTVGLDVYRGGCGLSATVTMQRNTCDEPQSTFDRLASTCGWKDWGEKRFIYDDIPTNGSVIFPPITSVAFEGSHEYRMSVTVTGAKLETVDPRGRFRGALLPVGQSFTHTGPTVRLDN